MPLNKGEQLHNHYLCELVKHLNFIGEDPLQVQSVLVEPIWTRPESTAMNSLCDLILIYDNYDVAVELKGTKKKRQKATDQLYQGQQYIEEVLGHRAAYGKFAVYQRGRYLWERIEYDRRQRWTDI